LSGTATFWSWFSVLISSFGLVYLYKTTSSDPGMIPVGSASDTRRGDKDKGEVYQNLDSPVLWSGNWNQLCVTCKIVRPLRSKHCAVTNRCIEVQLSNTTESRCLDYDCRCLIITVHGLVMQLAKEIDTFLCGSYGWK